jgi:hypothetical protein
VLILSTNAARPIGDAAPVRMLVQGTPDVGYRDGEEKRAR